jgi:nitrate reductase NapD
MSARARESITNDETPEGHIAGIVVHANLAHFESIRRFISKLPDAQIHAASPAGKLVITLEAKHSADIVEQLTAIHALTGVYSAALIYQHHEDVESLDEEIGDETDPAGVH